jgi:hypothetical protein
LIAARAITSIPDWRLAALHFRFSLVFSMVKLKFFEADPQNRA